MLSRDVMPILEAVIHPMTTYAVVQTVSHISIEPATHVKELSADVRMDTVLLSKKLTKQDNTT